MSSIPSRFENYSSGTGQIVSMRPTDHPLQAITNKLIDPTERRYIIHLNSEMADTFGTLPTDFQVTLSQPIVSSESECLYISIDNVAIPYSFYGISELNNTVQVTEYDINDENPETFNVTIDSGNYNYATLATEFEAVINDQSKKGYTYALAYNKTTNKYAITSLDAHAIFDFNLDNSIYRQLGFDLKQYTLTSSLISDSVIEMLSQSHLYIRFLDYNLDRAYDIYTRSTSNILSKVPVNSGAGGIIYLNDNTNFETPLKESIISTLHFQLTDEWSQLIDLNKKSYSFDLIVHVVKKISSK
jgi:hypothetical protein